MPIVDLPALQLIEERLITDVQSTRGLLAIPTRFFQDPQYKLLFRLLCRASSNVFKRHVVFLRFHGYGNRRRRLSLFFELRKIHVHVGQDEITLHRIFELANIAGPVVSKK